MISADFAPNEQLDDALLSLGLLFQPWRWQKGKETESVRKQIVKMFFSNLQLQTSNISLFLSGRAALHHLLKSFNLPSDSSILVQAFTCEAVVLPIIHAGLKPVYVDIEKETLSMDMADLEKKYDGRCRVLILQHTFGLTPRYRDQILRLAKINGLIVIEDLAHGFSEEFTKHQSLTTNHYFLLSFGRSKPFSSVFGGAVAGLNQKIEDRLIQPTYSFIFSCLIYKPIALLIKSTYNIFIGRLIHKVAENLHLLTREISEKEKKGVYDSLLDKSYPNALAILLLYQLKKFNQAQNIRSRVVKYYLDNLNIKNSLKIENGKLLRFPIIVNSRDKIVEKARRQNIFLGLWYDQVVAPKSLDLNKVYYLIGSCPTAEEISSKIINLPTLITEKEAGQVVDIFKL